jgi:hypothetical protein
MIGRIRHYRRVAAYHGLELVAGAGAFVAAWLLRRYFEAHFHESLPPLKQILWLAPVYLAFWSAYTWGTGAYLAFRVRGAVSHAFSLAAVNALTAFSVFGLLMMLRVVDINRSLILITALANLSVLFPMRIVARTTAATTARCGPAFRRRHECGGGAVAGRSRPSGRRLPVRD